MVVVTLAEREAAAVAAKTAAVEALCPTLAHYAAKRGGRFLMFGSAARRDLRPDSDVDLLLDFRDHQTTSAAWRFAEDACARLQLVCDARPVSWCSSAFLDHVLPHSRSLP